MHTLSLYARFTHHKIETFTTNIEDIMKKLFKIAVIILASIAAFQVVIGIAAGVLVGVNSIG